MKKQFLKNNVTGLTTKINAGGKCNQGLHNKVSIKRELLTDNDIFHLPLVDLQKKWMQRINLVWICIYCGKKEFLEYTTEKEKQEINTMSNNDLQKRLDSQDHIATFYGQRLKREERLRN